MVIQCPQCTNLSLSVTSWHDAEAGTIVFDVKCGNCGYMNYQVMDK